MAVSSAESTQRKIADVPIEREIAITFDDLPVASTRNDLESISQVAAAYVPYMTSKVDYFEEQSLKLFGRRISQILRCTRIQ